MIQKDISDKLKAISELSGVPVNYLVAHLSDAGEGVSIADDGVIEDLYYSNTKGLLQSSFTVEIFAKKSARFIQMREAIKDEFHGFKGLSGETNFINTTVLSDIPTTVTRDSAQVFRSIMTIQTVTN